MGTKNQPGEFDCHGAAHGDEPIFTLRADDEQAPEVVVDWIKARLFREFLAGRLELVDEDRDRKLKQASECEMDMRAWKAETLDPSDG